jgi:ABC-type Fe3+/spermidine/putrescine transport system ATPase subunit
MTTKKTLHPLLQVNNVNKRYGSVPVLRDISFSLDRGEILCLLGPSGSGKTTLLRLLAGLEAPDSGRLLCSGRDITAIPPHKREFGMMFQEYALFPHKSVAGNICFGLETAGWGQNRQQKRLAEMLTLVGLENKGERRIDELSGGERQRVALARSLAPDPRLLLLDEPLGSLDRVLRDRLAGEIRTILKSQQVTAVFVTHDQAEAFAVADQVGVLRRGRMEQFAPPEDVYRYPASAEVAAFLGFHNLIDCTLHPPAGFIDNLPRPLAEHSGLLLIRPEGAKLVPPGDAVKNGPNLCGQIVQRIFQGRNYSLEIKSNGIRLHFDLPLDPAPPQVDSTVILALNPSAMVPLSGERS